VKAKLKMLSSSIGNKELDPLKSYSNLMSTVQDKSALETEAVNYRPREQRATFETLLRSGQGSEYKKTYEALLKCESEDFTGKK